MQTPRWDDKTAYTKGSLSDRSRFGGLSGATALHSALYYCLTQDFPLETYHSHSHFILYLDDQVNSRFTLFALQNISPGMCGCTDWLSQCTASWCKSMLQQQLSQVQRFLLDDPAFLFLRCWCRGIAKIWKGTAFFISVNTALCLVLILKRSLAPLAYLQLALTDEQVVFWWV